MTSPKFKLRNYPFFWVLLSWGAAPKSLYLQKLYVLKGSSFCDRRRLNFLAFCIYIFLMAWTWKHRIVLRCFATPPSRNIWHLKIWLGFTNYRETSKCDHDWYTTGPNNRTRIQNTKKTVQPKPFSWNLSWTTTSFRRQQPLLEGKVL